MFICLGKSLEKHIKVDCVLLFQQLKSNNLHGRIDQSAIKVHNLQHQQPRKKRLTLALLNRLYVNKLYKLLVKVKTLHY